MGFAMRATYDSRIRFVVSELTAGQIEALKREFTYSNPAFHKMLAMKRKPFGIPKYITSWEQTATEFNVPRGALARVEQLLGPLRLTFRMTQGDPELAGGIGAHRLPLRPYQQTLKEACLRRNTSLLRSPPGCLSGKTEVGVNRAGKGSTMKLEHVVHMFNGGKASGRRWDLSIPTFVRARLDDGTVGLVELRAAYVSGVKQTFKLKTEKGLLKATADHRILTDNGWRRIGEMKVGDLVWAEERNIRCTTKLVPVLQIAEALEEETYDLTMAGPHNFIADGIVVHNSGKTTVGYAIAAELQLPTLVVVPTEKIFAQWVRGVEKNLGMDPSDVGIIQGQRRIIRPLTIGMQQTLKNCAKEYLDVFGVIIADEAQRFAADTFFDVVDLFPAAYRIGMSADERRADGKEFLIYDVLGPVAQDVPRETLIEQGSIIDAEIRIVPTEFDAPWYTRLQPRQRMQSEAQQRLIEELCKDKARNTLILRVLEWCIADEQPTITLAWRREHCTTLNSMALAKGWDSGLLLGDGDSKGEFDRTEREMREGTLKQAVGTYQAVGVGFDLPAVSRGIFAAPCASKEGRQQFVQFCGRYERPEPATGKVNQGDAIIYYLWDRKVNGIYPVQNIARWKKDVYVLEGDTWVPAKQYVKQVSSERKRDSEEDVLGFETVRR